MKFHVLSLSFLLTCFIISSSNFLLTKAYAQDVSKKNVATVNGVTISADEFNKTYHQTKLYVSGQKVTKEKVLDDMINRILGIQRAKKNGIDKDPIVISKLEDILYHAQLSKDLEPQLKKIVVTDDEVKEYYTKNKEYRTAHILIRVPVDATDKEDEAMKKRIDDISIKLSKDPAKFPELASKFSESSTAPAGGDMGFQPPVNYPAEYFEAINGKPLEFITPPVRTQYGYHIIKVLAVKDFKSIDIETYKKIIYDIKRDKIIAQYFQDLRKSADIKIQ